MILFILLSCQEAIQATKTPVIESETAVFTSVSMDYAIGSLSAITTASLDVHQDISSVSGDPILRFEGGYLWQLNRFNYDTIRKYDSSDLSRPLTEVSVSPENGSSNPHDVAICDDQLFISLFEQSEILILSPEDLSELGRIDILDFADSDQRTEASSLLVLQGKLYLGLQGLDRNNGYSNIGSTLLEIDCSEHKVSRSWTFGANIQLVDWTEDTFLISSHTLEEHSAGLYSFKPETETFETIITSAENISSTTSNGDQIAFLSTGSTEDSYTLNCFNGEEWYTTTGFLEYLPDLGINQSSEIWVTAHWGWIDPNNAFSGIYRFDSTCQELEPNAIPLNLAPNSLVFVTPE